MTVSWQDVSEDVHASLVFGVGTRDEGVDRIGLNHLVQLLVLDEISTEADQHTTFVDTSFTASGTPDEVAAHLAECCAVLADLPLDRLDEIAAQADPGDLVMSLGLELDSSGGGGRGLRRPKRRWGRLPSSPRDDQRTACR
ncbi:hypothetical protein CS0771_57170 [Catellatospora sp. IY07-71]|uniref:hypothetical protein n=1 Tax=Catellatospora sp. IY07-71 TaxID=2728827 RepID=UPI001BB41218|nr:hypothetical protein [Catellatospora sp. IY07-71]BCJ76173.1 hypothetical protein CS0771_57170 [Catellatospora sp. IY07-71]